MRQRCLNPNGPSFRHYGGRGITVCRRWRHFANFLADMGSRASRRHSLERTDNAKGYGPRNCVWALKRQQCNNTRRCVYITVFGQRMTLTQASRRFHIHPKALEYRLRVIGVSPEHAVTIPMRHIKMLHSKKLST